MHLPNSNSDSDTFLELQQQTLEGKKGKELQDETLKLNEKKIINDDKDCTVLLEGKIVSPMTDTVMKEASEKKQDPKIPEKIP